MAKKRVAVLISGRGSNMEALIRAAEKKDYPAEISFVLSNKADAAGLQFAAKHHIKTGVINHKDFPNRDAFDAAIHAKLLEEKIDIVCLAGFMRVLTPGFVEKWNGKMINIHPSLLPLYKGLDTHKRALEAGDKFHGCTVHYVVPEMDSGPIILQAKVPVNSDDTEEILAARVLKEEHRIYPEALKLVAEK